MLWLSLIECNNTTLYWLSSRNFFQGAKSIVMQISFVMLIFLLFWTKFQGGQTASGEGAPPVEESQLYKLCAFREMICILGNAYLHREWGCVSPGKHILTGNGDVPHREWGCASPGMQILTGNGDVPHRKWGCASPGMHILTGNGDVPHRECISSPGMGMCLTGNAHSLYRVNTNTFLRRFCSLHAFLPTYHVVSFKCFNTFIQERNFTPELVLII